MKNLFAFLDAGNGASTLVAPKGPMESPVTYTFSSKTTQQLIEEIHDSFNTAGDKLLAEAKAVIAGTDESSFAKAKRLKALGFTMATGVQTMDAVKQKLATSKTLQQTLLDYAVKYPTYRFIDEAGIKTICEKYHLVFGCISDYKGFVPEKNLAEIEKAPWNAKLRPEHRTRTTRRTSEYGPWELTSDTMKEHLAKNSDYTFTGNSYVGHTIEWQFRNSSSFLICAPEKDMDMQGKKLEGHKVVNLEIPDPVVLHPMGNGFYAILTAWGDESADPLVAKQGLN